MMFTYDELRFMQKLFQLRLDYLVKLNDSDFKAEETKNCLGVCEKIDNEIKRLIGKCCEVN